MHCLFPRRRCDVEGGESGLRGEVAQGLPLRSAGPGAFPLPRATARSARLSAGKDSDQSNGHPLVAIPGAAAGSAGRWLLEIPASLSFNPEKRSNDLPPGFRAFPSGESARRVADCGERSASAGPRNARSAVEYQRTRAFYRLPLASGSARAFTTAATSFCIRAKCRRTKTRREFPIPFWKRWPPGCRCSRPGTAEFRRPWRTDAAALLVDERDYQGLAAEMKKITRTPHSFAEMGILASESVSADFEQGAHIAQSGSALPAKRSRLQTKPWPSPDRKYR